MEDKLTDKELATLLLICEYAGKNPGAKTVDTAFQRKMQEVLRYRQQAAGTY